jgi:tetratricopeptide (TPR) repeat protein
MVTKREARQAVGALAFLVAAGLAGPLRAADDDLRQKALRLNEVTGRASIEGQVQALLKDPAGTRKLLAVAARMAKEKPQPFNLNATLILGVTAQDLKDADTAEAFYRLRLDQSLKLFSGQALSQTYARLIQLLYDNKKYAESEKLCREFLGIEGDESIESLKAPVLRQLILSLYKRGEADKAQELLERIIKAQPANFFNLELKAVLLRDSDKVDESIKVYEEVIQRVKKDDRLTKEEREDFLDRYRYALSGLYADVNQVDKAAEQLKALLAKQPDNPTYNNDLGYIWADHDLNLAESERMIRKAIEEDRKQRRKDNPDLKGDRDNAAYLDSLGWVLFKQKKYKEAKAQLLEAVKDEEGRHIEIYDHLGDVHLALGEKAQAVAAWKKGVLVAGPGPREQKRKAEVEKKMKANE